MAALEVRRATSADAAQVRAVVEQSYALYLPRMAGRPAPLDQDYREVLESSIGWVAELGGEILGVAIARIHADHVLLENVAVLPAAQGRGAGRLLITQVERYTVLLGVPQVRLYTNAVMTENLAFYLRSGYHETHRGDQDGFHRVYFSKTVLPLPG